ncbi:hypothetical protein VT84_30655 [Gemmata sp. SH-PL17]|uniref:hypothetical protein n=1 Tax=Gemmata sp. SH-PL17 TaxID=1630693 RepID=UPI00078B31B4|nr:hypothetical protein [Gemmata sp. SH-PL17]AMV28794.1 hypothetical protein VT84_30655 [Gemmata sp. SH-PL17]
MLTSFTETVNAAHPGPHAVICDGVLLFQYPTYLEAADRACDLESVGCTAVVVPVDLHN